MCRWEVGKYMIQVNNTKMTVSYVAHLPGGQQYENDCIICSSPSWWYFDETLEDAAERLRMKRKVNKNLA
ncbi:hypothetical protein EVAR_70629_1 [Eumeta japonica]|uniref:Uncharacterized protein n=1 Tax=Eumeta variegata TaxID=151549 RepID=A0A4C2A7F8_EUMVA|nr:hypothetical protein EVAR_70629_1 [Eumeta japonica]